MEDWLKVKEQEASYTPFPLCLEELIVFYGNIVSHLPGKYWAYDLRERIQKYRDNKHCVDLMNWLAHKFDYFSKHMASKLEGHFKDTFEGQLGMIKSPGQTDWTRAVWCIYSEVQKRGFTGNFTVDVLAQMELWLSQHRKRGTTTVKTNEDASPTNDFLRHVRRRLEKEEVNDTVSLELWTKKLDVFCSHLENVVKQQPTTYYDKIMDLFYELQGQVHSSPDTERISAIIQEITDKVDEEAQNTTFIYHDASIFEFENKEENIMDVLEILPEELQEMTAPSRARSPSRSPDPSFSPVARPSPQGRHGGGVGGSGRRVNMSGLLHALQALKY
jgi:hypothetical protein